jgi:hypothetical protein
MWILVIFATLEALDGGLQMFYEFQKHMNNM